MPGGRPSKYVPKLNKQAESLARLGLTDKEIAEFFGIAESTFYEWKDAYPKFAEAIKKGKLPADAKVVDSLFKRATGYKYKEVIYEKIDTKEVLDAESDSTITKDIYRKRITTREVSPDTMAAIYWLNNRRSNVEKGAQRWAQKQEIDHSNRGEKFGTVPLVVIQNPNNDDAQ
jgi:hypothetical protein